MVFSRLCRPVMYGAQVVARAHLRSNVARPNVNNFDRFVGSRLFSSVSVDGDSEKGAADETASQEGDAEAEAEVTEEEIEVEEEFITLVDYMQNHPNADEWNIQGNFVKEDNVARIHELWRQDPITWSFDRLATRFAIKKPTVRAMMMLQEEIAGNCRNPRQFQILLDQRLLEAAEKAQARKERREAALEAQARGEEVEVEQEEDLDTKARFSFWGSEEAKREANEGDEETPLSTEYEMLEDHEDEEEVNRRLDRAQRRRERRTAYLMDRIRKIPQVPNPPLEYPSLESKSGARLLSPKWKYVFVDISRTRDDKKMENLLIRDPDTTGEGLQQLRTATAQEEQQWRAPVQIDEGLVENK